jgi:DoxX-like protein
MEAIMPTDTQPVTLSNGILWAGGIVTGFVVLFLAFDGVTKVIKVAPVVEASEKIGIPPHALLGIGIVLLACTTIYAIPRTAVLGAILLTGYLGGATAIHVRAGSGVFPVVFSIAFGVLAWVGLVLREPRLLRTILMRQ